MGRYRDALSAVGRLDTPQGDLVLLLADRLAAGGHSASGVASLSRELRAAWVEATRDATAAKDGVTSLAEQWKARRGAR